MAIRLLLSLIMATALCACGAPGAVSPSVEASLTPPPSLVDAAAALDGHRHRHPTPTPSPSPTLRPQRLYLSLTTDSATASNGTIDIFPDPLASNASPLVRIPLGQVLMGPLALDGAGHLAACEFADKAPFLQHVVLFSAPFLASSVPAVTLTLPSFGCGALAFDRHGKLYASSFYGPGHVWVYSPPFKSSSVPSRTISKGLTSPDGLAFDASDNLYVSDNGSGAVAPSVFVYAAPFESPKYEITNGFVGSTSGATPSPRLLSIAVRTNGDLYVTDNMQPTAPVLRVFQAPLSAASAPSFSLGLPLNLFALPSTLAFDNRGIVFTAGGFDIVGYASPLSATSMPSESNVGSPCCYEGLAIGP